MLLFCSQYLAQSSPEAHIQGATALCCLFQVGLLYILIVTKMLFGFQYQLQGNTAVLQSKEYWILEVLVCEEGCILRETDKAKRK